MEKLLSLSTYRARKTCNIPIQPEITELTIRDSSKLLIYFLWHLYVIDIVADDDLVTKMAKSIILADAQKNKTIDSPISNRIDSVSYRGYI